MNNITQAYRNLWDAIQDVDTPKEEHLNIKFRMSELHAEIPQEEFEVLADDLPGYRAFQVRLKDIRASKFPMIEYDTSLDGIAAIANHGKYQPSMTDSEFLKWKRKHFDHLGDSDDS